ncbi:hypothetical protein K432DRAFT_469541 [Lepidopterella palustris CBS 459.81]|uniref:Heterokaryon incompatibility domain-containing protein n=1 Tax=Lepidopterella palustris CBS 459.81 TaxID=1314670 RepID=A0A8E2DZB2_9PEZI|nr:hypothetical protein K432DRAFT_469541 [Lepidopterella palustris CBS 459.81]
MSFLTIESGATNYEHAAISAPNTIRVLILHPGKGHNQLRCSFREHTILNAQDLTALNWTRNSPGVGPYQAISYTWHDDDCQNQPDHIYCDGKPIQITKNVANILYRLRGVSPQELWIDQLCIDQHNDIRRRRRFH